MSFIDQLTGQTIGAIGRASNMLCISIGRTVGRTRNGWDLTKYEIHCQCAWRILDPEQKIFVASTDFYIPDSNNCWSNSFQWDINGVNLFDEKIKQFNEYHKNTKIKSAEIAKCNDIIIELEDATVFEAFTDSSVEENWRIIQRSPISVHLVSFGNQLRVDTESGTCVNTGD